MNALSKVTAFSKVDEFWDSLTDSEDDSRSINIFLIISIMLPELLFVALVF